MTSRYDNRFVLVDPEPIAPFGTAASYNDFTNAFGGWAEPDTAVGDPASQFVSGQSFTTGTRRYYQGKIYVRLTNGVGTLDPAVDTANWLYESPTNRWKLFDGSNSTQSIRPGAAAPFSVTWSVVMPNAADIAVFDNIVCDQLRVIVRINGVAGSIIYDSGAVTVTGKPSAVFRGLPRGYNQTYEVTATSTTSNSSIKIGTMVLGIANLIGEPQYGATVGIVDYSTKTADSFGNFNVVQRGFSKRMSVPVEIDNTYLDDIAATLAEFRAKPAMWLGAGSLFTSMIMYGYYRNFEIIVPGPRTSLCNIDIEGLT